MMAPNSIFVTITHIYAHFFTFFLYTKYQDFTHICGSKTPIFFNWKSKFMWHMIIEGFECQHNRNVSPLCDAFFFPWVFRLIVYFFVLSINFFLCWEKKIKSKSKSIALNGIYILHICVFIHYCSISSFRKNCSVCETRT